MPRFAECAADRAISQLTQHNSFPTPHWVPTHSQEDIFESDYSRTTVTFSSKVSSGNGLTAPDYEFAYAACLLDCLQESRSCQCLQEVIKAATITSE